MNNPAYAAALRLLARREHGAQELLNKLKHKGYAHQLAQLAIAECQRLGYQSDERFAESLCRTRMNQGYGPLRIRQELQHLQIDPDIIHSTFNKLETPWVDLAQMTWRKKFPQGSEFSPLEQEKQRKFLIYRGFSHDIINQIFKGPAK